MHLPYNSLKTSIKSLTNITTKYSDQFKVFLATMTLCKEIYLKRKTFLSFANYFHQYTQIISCLPKCIMHCFAIFTKTFPIFTILPKVWQKKIDTSLYCSKNFPTFPCIKLLFMKRSNNCFWDYWIFQKGAFKTPFFKYLTNISTKLVKKVHIYS